MILISISVDNNQSMEANFEAPCSPDVKKEIDSYSCDTKLSKLDLI